MGDTDCFVVGCHPNSLQRIGVGVYVLYVSVTSLDEKSVPLDESFLMFFKHEISQNNLIELRGNTEAEIKKIKSLVGAMGAATVSGD